MSNNGSRESNDLRSAAELLINNARAMNYRNAIGVGQMPPGFDVTRAHSINLITEEFLGGYMQDGRMSVVRRFFCLFVTFDLFFVSLLWLICIMINGDNIFQAFQKQIIHYTIYTSLFDVVAAAICRFMVLIIFYALLYINHWLIITLSTSGSCLFLISKVFVFNWIGTNQQVFVVILIITSFVLAWGEAWFFDCRVIPQERHARHYFSSPTSSDLSPLMAPLLTQTAELRPPESVANFYSPLDSAPNSSDGEDEQDEDYHQMGLDCVRKAYNLLETTEWRVEKVTSKGDTIYSTQREKLGKIYKLTGSIKYPAKALLEELFYKIEMVPQWNPTILESKIVRKVNTYTDITYQATVGGGGGLVKSRDFVNLRCWRLFRDGKMCDDDLAEGSISTDDDDENSLNRSYEGSVSTVSYDDDRTSTYTPQPSSVGSTRSQIKLPTSSSSIMHLTASTYDNPNEIKNNTVFDTLSKSLGAKDFNTTIIPPRIDFEEPPPLEDDFQDAKDNLDEMSTTTNVAGVTAAVNGTTQMKVVNKKPKVWISAAVSIDYAKVPPTTKYTRGENIVAGFALHEVYGKSDVCIFEWILCLDLKGYIPRYVLDTAYTTFMTDYMMYLRKYVNELRQKRKRVPKNKSLNLN